MMPALAIRREILAAEYARAVKLCDTRAMRRFWRELHKATNDMMRVK